MALVHGGWSGWQPWSTCSTSCGGGERFRARLCNEPEPAYGGRDCIGSAEQTDFCNTESCPSKLSILIGQNQSPSVLDIIVKVGSKMSDLSKGEGHVEEKATVISQVGSEGKPANVSDLQNDARAQGELYPTHASSTSV